MNDLNWIFYWIVWVQRWLSDFIIRIIIMIISHAQNWTRIYKFTEMKPKKIHISKKWLASMARESNFVYNVSKFHHSKYPIMSAPIFSCIFAHQVYWQCFNVFIRDFERKSRVEANRQPTVYLRRKWAWERCDISCGLEKANRKRVDEIAARRMRAGKQMLQSAWNQAY